jgi:hypothetical protein
MGLNVVYDSKEQFFTITLFTEPLGAARARAEKFLLAALGITSTQACALNYYVGTMESVSTFYAGENLGFSFARELLRFRNNFLVP